MRLQVKNLKQVAIFDVKKNMEWLMRQEKKISKNNSCNSKKTYRLKMQMIFDALNKK